MQNQVGIKGEARMFSKKHGQPLHLKYIELNLKYDYRLKYIVKNIYRLELTKLLGSYEV